MEEYNVLDFLILIFIFLFEGMNLSAQDIILTSDQQLNDLMDPDKKIDTSVSNRPISQSLREICEMSKRNGAKELTIAFDEFFRQYRPQAGTIRKLTPDRDEYINKIKFISNFAKSYGLGIRLSLLSPLELGPAYKHQTGETGRWLSYKVGLRNASDGKFNISMWEQVYWTNNKGKFQIQLKGVKAYAFKQHPLGNSGLIAVDPGDIVEIKGVRYEVGDTVDVSDNDASDKPINKMAFPACNLHIYYDGPKQLKGYDRVLVLLEYETPEMDYFSPRAPLFLKELINKYHQAGVHLTSFYSDEMHIQQDWSYFSHHEGGQFNTRFLTPSFSSEYKKKYGQDLSDKYLLYFVYGAPYYEASAITVRNIQYVMGDTPEKIHRTYLLRDRYYKMLNNGVVNLFENAKNYAEHLFKRKMRTEGHSSWAESPTIDLWDVGKLNAMAYKYEYTSNYVWSNTVHQASAACYDYFKWGEYLSPTGNDFAECGWGDRDYYGAAMAASIGVINKISNACADVWGFPNAVIAWKNAINEAFGCRPSPSMKLMTDNVHRDIEVLMIYPLSLVAVEERFGSWMTQYGYANYLTSEKLLEMGKLLPDGQIQVGEKKYGTVVVTFEPLPDKKLLEMLTRFAENGGKVIWCSMPPLIDNEGNDCTKKWQALFGIRYNHDVFNGEIASGKKIDFINSFAKVPQQTILTDFLVDRIYPVHLLSNDVEVVAREENKIVGTKLKVGRGMAYYCGFRPRDDQSASLGYETRTLFEILNATDSYPSSGKFEVNDNPSYVSRTTDFLATRFPNGTTAIVKHYRTHRENWDGGFSRNEEADEKALAVNPVPSDKLDIKDLKVSGHQLTYNGKMNMAFRLNSEGRLIAFYGQQCTRVFIDGKRYTFSDFPIDIVFSPVKDNKKIYRVCIHGESQVTLPLPLNTKKVVVKQGGTTINSILRKNDLLLKIDKNFSGKWLDIMLN
jgi:hypothetical protein